MGDNLDDLSKELSAKTNLSLNTIYDLIESGWDFIEVEGQPSFWLAPKKIESES